MSNWNANTRIIYPATGPQNPYKIYVFSNGNEYWYRRYKPGNGPAYSLNIVAIFTVKYNI